MCCAPQTCDPLVLLRCKLGFALGQVLILPASAHQPLRERVCDVSETYWRPIQMEERNRAAVCVCAFWTYAVGWLCSRCLYLFLVCVLAMCSPYKVIMSRSSSTRLLMAISSPKPQTHHALVRTVMCQQSGVWSENKNHFWPRRAPTAAYKLWQQKERLSRGDRRED